MPPPGSSTFAFPGFEFLICKERETGILTCRIRKTLAEVTRDLVLRTEIEFLEQLMPVNTMFQQIEEKMYF